MRAQRRRAHDPSRAPGGSRDPQQSPRIGAPRKLLRRNRSGGADKVPAHVGSHLERDKASSPPLDDAPPCDSGLWEPGQLDAAHGVGFHRASAADAVALRWSEPAADAVAIRWSEPAAYVEVPLAPGRYVMRLNWLFLRGSAARRSHASTSTKGPFRSRTCPSSETSSSSAWTFPSRRHSRASGGSAGPIVPTATTGRSACRSSAWPGPARTHARASSVRPNGRGARPHRHRAPRCAHGRSAAHHGPHQCAAPCSHLAASCPQVSDVVLREWDQHGPVDGGSVEVGELGDAPRDVAIDGQVQRLDQKTRHPAYFGDQCVGQDTFHGRMLEPKPSRTSRWSARVSTTSRQTIVALRGAGATTARLDPSTGPSAQHPEQRRSPSGVAMPHRDVSFRDQVERVTGIALVEHDLAANEASTSGGRQHLARLASANEPSRPHSTCGILGPIDAAEPGRRLAGLCDALEGGCYPRPQRASGRWAGATTRWPPTWLRLTGAGGVIVDTICCSDSCAAAGEGAFVEIELVPVGVIVETIC